MLTRMTSGHQYHRNAGAPYPTRGNRVQRPRPHQHRTLHLNALGNSSNNDTDSGGSDSARWVTKNDRHRQIINANVYEKESQNRAKAMEQTRQRKQDEHRRGEKARFHDFLTQQNAHANTGGNSNATRAANNEITIADIRFRVLDGGKKLAKIIGPYMWPPFIALLADCFQMGQMTLQKRLKTR